MLIGITVNGSSVRVASGCTVEALAAERGLMECGGVAIAVNDVVVRRGQWAARTLQPGDRVLIITAAQGG